MSSHFDSVKRENMALTSNIEIFRKSEEQLRQENSNLKDLINNIEAERIHYRAVSEQLQRELAYSKKENTVSYKPPENGILNYNRAQEDSYKPPQFDDRSDLMNRLRR